MTTLILAAMLLMQAKPAETLKPEEPPKKAPEVVKVAEAAEVEDETGSGPFVPVTINDELSVRPLGWQAWVIVHAKPWAANSLLVRMPDGTLVLCDTPYDDEATMQLLGWMRKTFGGDAKIVVVNSHFHADALGGNGAVLAAGATSYGSKMTAKMLEKRGAKLKSQLLEMLGEKEETKALGARFKDTTWLPPANQFDPAEGMELTFGDEKLELYYPGAGHSPDNIVVWFPNRKLLFGGCLVRAGDSIPNVADADLEEWPRSIEKLRRFEAQIVIPGHGPSGGPGLLDHTIDVIAKHVAASR